MLTSAIVSSLIHFIMYTLRIRELMILIKFTRIAN